MAGVPRPNRNAKGRSNITLSQRKELRERTHLEIATAAAVSAGLAQDENSARREIERIIESNGERLKQQWIRERGGGIKGWLYFLRTFGFEEVQVIRKIDK